jgi:hypothetical protein
MDFRDGEMTHLPSFEAACRLGAGWAAQALLWALCFALLEMAQNGSGQQRPILQQPIGQPVSGGLDDVPVGVPVQNERLLRALNADRQKSLVADTNKLLRLVNELNAEIAHTTPDSLSAAQLRKMAEIEKLAHNVRDKMSTSVRGTPAFEPPFQPVRH